MRSLSNAILLLVTTESILPCIYLKPFKHLVPSVNLKGLNPFNQNIPAKIGLILSSSNNKYIVAFELTMKKFSTYTIK
jgi:hypothetical protein